MVEYKCSVCGQRIKDGVEVYVKHTEEHIINLIKEKRPDWVAEDGICHKCHEYYKKQIKGEDIKF